MPRSLFGTGPVATAVGVFTATRAPSPTAFIIFFDDPLCVAQDYSAKIAVSRESDLVGCDWLSREA